MQVIESLEYEYVVGAICELNWSGLTEDDLITVARAYYFFSVQFRENLEIACELFPDDPQLYRLVREECNTDNLSPWPGVAVAGETMNHDEFMARLLRLEPTYNRRGCLLHEIGHAYLALVRNTSPVARALSIASYEDGGLERVFRAFLTARHWDNTLLQAFRHFLTEHIKFDSDPEQGHGALSRHITPDDRILPLWSAFEHLLVQAVPNLKSRN